MSNLKSHAGGFLAVVFGIFAIMAGDTVYGLNFFGAGANFANDLDVKVTGTASEASGIFDVRTGFRFSAGYEFTFPKFVSVQVESGFIYNDTVNEDLSEFSAWYGQVPLLMNVVFRYDFESGWTPFIGVGGGASVGILDLSFRDTPQTTVEESSVKLVPAWQLIGGLQYRLNENWAIAVLYKYLETGAPEIRMQDETFRLSTVHNHYVGVQLNYSF